MLTKKYGELLESGPILQPGDLDLFEVNNPGDDWGDWKWLCNAVPVVPGTGISNLFFYIRPNCPFIYLGGIQMQAGWAYEPGKQARLECNIHVTSPNSIMRGFTPLLGVRQDGFNYELAETVIDSSNWTVAWDFASFQLKVVFNNDEREPESGIQKFWFDLTFGAWIAGEWKAGAGPTRWVWLNKLLPRAIWRDEVEYLQLKK